MSPTRQARRTARRLYKDCVVDALLDEGRARQVALRIIEARRRRGLAILSHFERLVRLDASRHTATIESASPMPDDLIAQINANLTRVHGPGLKTAFVHNPALIGGMSVKVGSTVYDGSIRGRLAALEASLPRD
jgi:F-type H+-transporting ATPase subunit delta